MTKKKRFLWPILSLIMAMTAVLSPPTQAQNSAPWRVATATIKPWFFFDETGGRGVVHDILNEVVKSMGHTTTLHSVPLRRISTELLRGRAELSILIIGEETLHYPEALTIGNAPILSFSVVGVSLKSKKISINSLTQLKALHVGNIRLPYQVDAYLRQSSKHTAYNNTESLLKGLLSGRIDVATGAIPTLYDAAKKLGISQDIEVIYTLNKANMYLALSNKALGNNIESDIKKANKKIEEMKKNGRLAEIISKYSELMYFNNYQ